MPDIDNTLAALQDELDTIDTGWTGFVQGDDSGETLASEAAGYAFRAERLVDGLAVNAEGGTAQSCLDAVEAVEAALA